MLFFAAGLFIVACFAVNTTALSEAIVRHALASRKGVVFKDIHIARQRFTWPGRVDWGDVKLEIEVNGKKAGMEAPAVSVTGLEDLLSSRAHLLINARGARLVYDKGRAGDVTAALALEGHELSGPLTMGTLSWDKWQAQDVSLVLVVNAAGVQARAVTLKAYDGKVTGKVIVDMAPVPAYAVELFADGLDVARMAPANAGLAEELSGRLKGSLKLEGSATALRTLDTDLVMPAGGKISAVFLASLTRYLPQSREKERLDLLVNNGGKLVMEGFSFTMKSSRKGRYSGEIHLKSREVNLELNLTHEINTDGTLASLLAYAARILK